MKKSAIFVMTMFMAIITAVSCGKNKSSKSNPAEGIIEVVHESFDPPQELEGNYDAILRPLNSSVSGFIPGGKARVEIKDDIFWVKTFLEDDSRVIHIQSIYEGKRCPTIADDDNGDGLIDIVEMQKATGGVLIPLDGNMNSQMEGQEYYPSGNSFTYEKSANVHNMLEDLYSKNLPDDSTFSKLATDAPLNLEGRVIIIHGTADLSKVPETVKTAGERPRNMTIPITCGVIKRTSH